MLVPNVLTRMKQRNHGARVWIDAGEIGSFICIAPVACKRETGEIVRAAMLFRHDVFNVETNQWRCQLGNAAIFATVQGPIPNEITNSLLQSGSPSREDAPGLCLHDGYDVDCLDKFLVFGILGSRQGSVICLPAQFFNAGLKFRIGTKVQKRGRGFRRQRLG